MRRWSCYKDVEFKRKVVSSRARRYVASGVNALHFCTREREKSLVLKQTLEDLLRNHSRDPLSLNTSVQCVHPETVNPRVISFRFTPLFSNVTAAAFINLKPPSRTALHYFAAWNKAVSSNSGSGSSLGWPECNANISTQLWPNKHSPLCCSWSFPRRWICWSAEDVNVPEFFYMSQLNIIDGFLIFNWTDHIRKTLTVTDDNVYFIQTLYYLIHHSHLENIWFSSLVMVCGRKQNSSEHELQSGNRAFKGFIIQFFTNVSPAGCGEVQRGKDDSCIPAAPLWCDPSFLRDPLKDLELSPELRCALNIGKTNSVSFVLTPAPETRDRADTCSLLLCSGTLDLALVTADFVFCLLEWKQLHWKKNNSIHYKLDVSKN